MNTTSAIEAREIGNRTVVAGIAAIVLILLVAAVLLFINLPDANAFNARVEQFFVENDTLTGNSEIKLLEILAGSGTAFSDTLSSYRFVVFVLLMFVLRAWWRQRKAAKLSRVLTLLRFAMRMHTH